MHKTITLGGIVTVLPANIQVLSFRQIEKDYPTLDNPSSDNAALNEVADQFEAIFIENLLKQARDSKSRSAHGQPSSL